MGLYEKGFHRNSGFPFMYRNDPEISITEKVLEIRIPEQFTEQFFSRKLEISGRLFWNHSTFRNVPEYRSKKVTGKIVRESSRTRY